MRLKSILKVLIKTVQSYFVTSRVISVNTQIFIYTLFCIIAIISFLFISATALDFLFLTKSADLVQTAPLDKIRVSNETLRSSLDALELAQKISLENSKSTTISKNLKNDSTALSIAPLNDILDVVDPTKKVQSNDQAESTDIIATVASDPAFYDIYNKVDYSVLFNNKQLEVDKPDETDYTAFLANEFASDDIFSRIIFGQDYIKLIPKEVPEEVKLEKLRKVFTLIYGDNLQYIEGIDERIKNPNLAKNVTKE